MAVQSTFLGSVKVSGDEAKALTRKMRRGYAGTAAIDAAKNGQSLAASFVKSGTVAIKLKPVRSSRSNGR